MSCFYVEQPALCRSENTTCIASQYFSVSCVVKEVEITCDIVKVVMRGSNHSINHCATVGTNGERPGFREGDGFSRAQSFTKKTNDKTAKREGISCNEGKYLW